MTSKVPTHLSLRPMVTGDLGRVDGWLRQPHVARWFLAGTTLADELDDLRRCLTGEEPTEALTVLADGRPIGWCV